jgi:hypothetical protein
MTRMAAGRAITPGPGPRNPSLPAAGRLSSGLTEWSARPGPARPAWDESTQLWTCPAGPVFQSGEAQIQGIPGSSPSPPPFMLMATSAERDRPANVTAELSMA